MKCFSVSKLLPLYVRGSYGSKKKVHPGIQNQSGHCEAIKEGASINEVAFGMLIL